MTAVHDHPAPPRAVPRPAVHAPLHVVGGPARWWARLVHRKSAARGRVGAEHSLVLVQSDRFADGAAVDLDGDPRAGHPAGWLVDLRYRASDGTVLGAEFSERVVDPELPLWFAELAHATSAIPAASIFAFTGPALPAGAFVTPRGVAAGGVAMTDRIGEIRWWTRSGLIDTVATGPGEPELGPALRLLAETLVAFRGWPALREPDPVTGMPLPPGRTALPPARSAHSPLSDAI